MLSYIMVGSKQESEGSNVGLYFSAIVHLQSLSVLGQEADHSPHGLS